MNNVLNLNEIPEFSFFSGFAPFLTVTFHILCMFRQKSERKKQDEKNNEPR